MLHAMGYEPATIHKRLGDGFYEQRLIREQVAQLAGRRFLADYRSDEEQYKALMDAGIPVAPRHRRERRPDGPAEQTVTLAGGAQQQVLVPQLYARLKDGDLGGSGALLAGKEVNIQLSGELVNSAAIAGRDLDVISTTQSYARAAGQSSFGQCSRYCLPIDVRCCSIASSDRWHSLRHHPGTPNLPQPPQRLSH